MQEYFIKLIEQYKAATGVKKVDINSEMFQNEFFEWIMNNQFVGRDYKAYLGELKAIPEEEQDYIEIGKGVHDSIVLYSETPIITPYTEEMSRKTGKIIKANFMVEELPIVYNEANGKQNIAILDSSRKIITQNPYNKGNIANWEQLHNNGYDICVGVYGRTYDKDIESKIEQLRDLKNGLIKCFKEEYSVVSDKYFYAIYTDRNQTLFNKIFQSETNKKEKTKKLYR